MIFSPFTLIAGKPFKNATVEYLIVGGGGAGGQENGAFLNSGGGGGAGGFLSGSVFLNERMAPFNITVGAGGTWGGLDQQGNPGQNSSFLNVIAYGGGGGGARLSLNGGSGGSGGGAGYYGVGNTGTGGTGTTGQGYAGAASFYSSTPTTIYRAGGGGGAASSASVGTRTLVSIPGGAKAWLDGNIYAAGGGTEDGTALILSGSGGFSNTSALQVGGYNGIVKIRYPGSGSQFTGGDISYSGSYTYHTFSNTGSFELRFI